MEYKCPQCQSLIYSRRHKVCGHCGAVLPVELLLDEEQVRALDEQRRLEHQRAKEFNLGDDSSSL